jgi:cytochrome c oxidase subunit 2
MIDYLYSSGWGAFVIMLFFQIPFFIVFIRLIYKKTVLDSKPSDTEQKVYTKYEIMWLSTVVVLFLAVNFVSISYMPTVITAQATATKIPIKEVDVSAQSWAYEISDRTLEVGQPVRFSAKSVDTVHGFAVYHPDNRLLFTMMLIPGRKTAASIIHTFTEPGTYKVRCLEFCGIVHHDMQDVLTVVQNGN